MSPRRRSGRHRIPASCVSRRRGWPPLGASERVRSLPASTTCAEDLKCSCSARTYRVAGLVSESGQPVAGAAVEVIESPGTATVTDASGVYRLYGVAGDVHVRVTKDGYQPKSSGLTVAANLTLDFTLEQVSLSLDFGGLYSLTVTADSCGVAPVDERTRTYDAQVMQDGPNLNVVLSGAQFFTDNDKGHGFKGRVAPDGITFYLSGWDEYVYDGIYFSLVEFLGPSRFLTVTGSVPRLPHGRHLGPSRRHHLRGERSQCRTQLVVQHVAPTSVRAAAE